MRELLLATIAVGAVLMVVVQNFRAHGTSPIYGGARAEILIPLLAAEHGLVNVSRGGGTGESGGNRAVQTSSFDYAIPESARPQIKLELQKRIQTLISEHQGIELGNVTAGDAIMFRYDCGQRTGVVYIAFFPVSDEILRVHSLIVETAE